jgi:hypothetical protein
MSIEGGPWICPIFFDTPRSVFDPDPVPLENTAPPLAYEGRRRHLLAMWIDVDLDVGEQRRLTLERPYRTGRREVRVDVRELVPAGKSAVGGQRLVE